MSYCYDALGLLMFGIFERHWCLWLTPAIFNAERAIHRH